LVQKTHKVPRRTVFYVPCRIRTGKSLDRRASYRPAAAAGNRASGFTDALYCTGAGMCRSDPLEEKKASRSRQRAGRGNQNREIAAVLPMEGSGSKQFQNIFEWKEQTESTLSFDVCILYSKEDRGILSVFLRQTLRSMSEHPFFSEREI